MREVASSGPWAARLASAAAARDDLPGPAGYYDLLRPLCHRLDIWHTVYNHVMGGPQGVVEWFNGSALRPFLAPLDDDMRQDLRCRLQRADRPRLSGALRWPRVAAVSAAVHRGASAIECIAAYRALRLFTRTLVAIGPVSPMSSL